MPIWASMISHNPTNVMSHQIQAVELRSRFYPDICLSMDLTGMSNVCLLGRCSCVFGSLEKGRFFFTLGRSRYNRIISAFWFVCMFMCAPEQPVSPGREEEQKVRSNLGWSVQSIACSQAKFCPLRSPHVVVTYTYIYIYFCFITELINCMYTYFTHNGNGF